MVHNHSIVWKHIFWFSILIVFPCESWPTISSLSRSHLQIISVVDRPSIPVRLASTSSGLEKSSIVSEKETTVEGESANELGTHQQKDVTRLLDGALSADAESAQELLMLLRNFQQTSQFDRSEALLEKLLDYSFSKTHMPWWTRIQFMSRFSRRARLGSLRRVLDVTTPSEDEGKAEDDEAETQRNNLIRASFRSIWSSQPVEIVDDERQRRRRRALAVLLRDLAGDGNNSGNGKGTSIRTLERASRRREVPVEEILKRVPEGLETPFYEVLSSRKTYEVRRYEPFSMCSVAMGAPRIDPATTDAQISNPQLKGASAFGALAGYLFGKNRDGVRMKMTTPVFSSSSSLEGSSSTSMSFVLPSDYWGSSRVYNAPIPLENSGVSVTAVSDEAMLTRAVVVFGGYAKKSEVLERERTLRRKLESDGEWKLRTDSDEGGNDAMLAQYNDPFTPPWKRRNEISLPVERRF